MSKKSRIHIVLQYKGAQLFEAFGKTLDKPISIGRSSNCQWRIPEDDPYASGHHAVIRPDRNGFVLEDQNSTNGTFCNGKRVHEVTLVPGVKAVIGDSVIIVDEADAASNGEQMQFHSLEFVNGNDKGKILPLDSKKFIIGSADDCQYVYKNDLVSRHHAILRTDSRGECWLMDNESKNGVSVNKVTMPSGKERLLKDGDIISIALIDFRFLDKNKKHVRSYWGIKLLAILLTLGLATFVYLFYLSTAANAYDLFQKARQLASNEQFTEALATLDNAHNAREYKKFRSEIDDLRDRIMTWNMTQREWRNVVQMAKDKEWAGAAMTLGTMQCDRMENWNWNEDKAVAEKNVAVQLKRHIDVYLRAKGIFSNKNSTVEDIAKAASELKNTLGLSEKDVGSNELIAPLLTEMRDLLTDMDKNLANNARLNEILAPLSMRAPDYGKIADELKALEKNSVGIISQTAATYLKAIVKLQKSQDILLRNAAMLTEFEFQKIVFELDLPTMDECTVHAQITSARAMLENIHENFMVSYKQILYMHNKFKVMGIHPPNSHPLMREFMDKNVIASLVRCDALQKKIPNRTRKEPVGTYDRMLGIEYFYEILKNMPDKYDNLILERLEFKPDCVSLKGVLELLASYKAFVEQPENRWLLRGKIKEWRNYCAFQLEQLDKAIDSWMANAASSFGREAILYMGLAFYFAPDDKFPQARREDFAVAFKKFREPIARLDNEYDTASPEKAIEVREKILNSGIPGDPLVRRVWATKY